jgi:hypothetical protein
MVIPNDFFSSKRAKARKDAKRTTENILAALILIFCGLA